ncbi:hypothetical protein ACFS5L_02795 [Streptomyces phyllanthi]|uniref:Uncharacterized protein n=1 Tax=Streptomyces phyllanthi TaxID=1803180 RepID=A0A5N8VTJ7_9ACTN|nr:hypothetical protein [Streptomyces phyllanthi]MPY38571.1 hypothetical protein [Streptomyces phyllanthi]
MFDIHYTHVEEVDSVLTVTIAEGPGEHGFLLHVMRALPDDGAFDAELEDYELANANHDVTEAGVEDWSIDGNLLRMRLTSQASTVLGMETDLCLAVADDAAVEPLRRALLIALAPVEEQ